MWLCWLSDTNNPLHLRRHLDHPQKHTCQDLLEADHVSVRLLQHLFQHRRSLRPAVHDTSDVEAENGDICRRSACSCCFDHGAPCSKPPASMPAPDALAYDAEGEACDNCSTQACKGCDRRQVLDASKHSCLDACCRKGSCCAGTEELQAPKKASSTTWPVLLLLTGCWCGCCCLVLWWDSSSRTSPSARSLPGAAVEHCWRTNEWMEYGSANSFPYSCLSCCKSDALGEHSSR